MAPPRTAPGVRITVLESERAPSGEPLDLGGRLLTFTFEDSAEKADKVALDLDNYDLALFDRRDLVGGATLEVAWGYPGNMAPPRRVVIKKLRGFQTLTLEGQAVSVLLHRQARTRAWQSQSRSQVARAIAAEYGYQGEFVEIEETGEMLDTISQTAETDARFLRRLAAREGYEFSIDAGGFHWRSRDLSKAPTHVLTWVSDPGRGDILSVDLESDLTRRAGRVEVRGLDPLTKAPLSAVSTSANVARPTLGEIVEVVDPVTGSTSLEARNATASLHASAATTPAAAEREAAARFRQAERSAIKLSVSVVGDPTLRAKTVVEVRGISSLLSGNYSVTEAKHTLSGSGYQVALKLTRDAGGRRGGTGTTAPGQLQGGQLQGGEPNRAPPEKGGALTPVEVIDPASGTAHLEYRRGGRPLGTGDPEARP